MSAIEMDTPVWRGLESPKSLVASRSGRHTSWSTDSAPAEPESPTSTASGLSQPNLSVAHDARLGDVFISKHVTTFSTAPPAISTSRGNGVEDNVDSDDPWERKIVLSLDGGGIRGLSTLYILQRIMAAIELEEEDYGSKSSADSPLFRSDSDTVLKSLAGSYLPSHYFDYVSGTSTGGIIAVMLGRLRFTLEEAITSYEQLWQGMALHMSPYDRVPLRKGKSANTKGLEAALKKILENKSKHLGQSEMEAKLEELTLASDPRMCRTLVLAVEIDRKRGLRSPYLFRSYPFSGGRDRLTALNRNPEKDTEQIQVFDVCRATSAAPQYFQSVKLQDDKSKVKFRDGSLWTVNPAMEVYREISALHSDTDRPIFFLLSIGCDEPKRSGLTKMLSSRRSKSSQISWEKLVVHKMMDYKRQNHEFSYCRLTGPHLPDMDHNEWKFDGWGEKTFQSIRYAVDRFCNSNEREIKACAKTLVSRRRHRAKTARWEEFALGSQYVCGLCNEEERTPATEPFNDRFDFIDHLQGEHKSPPLTEQYFHDMQRILDNNRTFTTQLLGSR